MESISKSKVSMETIYKDREMDCVKAEEKSSKASTVEVRLSGTRLTGKLD